MIPDPSGFPRARAVADAVLYEGYVLYPYRATSGKNRVRWQFGVVGPPGVAGEEPDMRTECLLEALPGCTVDVRLRFLQLQARTVERSSPEGFAPVPELRVDGHAHLTWDEAVEHEAGMELAVADLLEAEREIPLMPSGGEEVEDLHDDLGAVAGRVRRRREPLTGVLRVSATEVQGPGRSRDPSGPEGPSMSRDPSGPGVVVRLRVEVENQTAPPTDEGRDAVVRRSFVAVHTLLSVRDGAFISLIDPPDEARDAARACSNHRTWPVLVGEPGERGVVLSSPIILYDYPEVAAESPGDLFDATEIDELLTLRVMTLTDEEKAEARATDPRAAAIIDRSDTMPPEVFERLHGAVRSVRPATPEYVVQVAGVSVGRGSRVRLRPSRRADAHDLFFAGQTATVAAVKVDFDDEVHLAVTLDDDPASDLHDWYGRYLYFAPDEVEPLEATMSEQDPTVSPADLEEAHPFDEVITASEEPQSERGAPGSRDWGQEVSEEGPEGREEAAREAESEHSTGVDPKEPIDPESPYLRPGDQGG